jgi:hypothetical protein
LRCGWRKIRERIEVSGYPARRSAASGRGRGAKGFLGRLGRLSRRRRFFRRRGEQIGEWTSAARGRAAEHAEHVFLGRGGG